MLIAAVDRGIERPQLPSGGVVVSRSGLGKTWLPRAALASAGQLGAPTIMSIATRSAASTPYAALAHLAPAVRAEQYTDPSSWYQAVAATLRLTRRPGPVLAVDDTHLLFARELNFGAVESGSLRCVDGTWIWDEALVLVPGLVDAVSARLQGLHPPESQALALVALGEPLRLEVAEQVATWQLELGDPVPADLLLDAAARANLGFDHVLAERLAEAAVHREAGPRAHVELARAYNGQNKFGPAASARPIRAASCWTRAGSPRRST